MKAGIIGSGNIGGNFGIHLAKAGHEVMFSSRHPEQLTELQEKAGPNAQTGTPDEAAVFGEIFPFLLNLLKKWLKIWQVCSEKKLSLTLATPTPAGMEK